jgi:oxygen-independent coproporphyrinogen-3 oxidase
MLNALRLVEGVPLDDFSARTGLSLHSIANPLAAGRQKGWLENHPYRLKTTALGQRFLNDVIASFLD